MFNLTDHKLIQAIATQLGYDAPPVTISPTETSTVLGATTGTLEVWRSTGRHGIPYIKIGSRVRYPIAGIAEFLAKNTRGAV